MTVQAAGDSAITRLEELVRTDATVTPLARLQVEALRASADPSWSECVTALDFDKPRLANGVPLLHGRTLALDLSRLRTLLANLADAAGDHRELLLRALESPEFDPLDALKAAVIQDVARLSTLAHLEGVDASALAVLLHLASVPLLRACGRRAVDDAGMPGWGRGYCPVCAAWPTLAEQRGIERVICARCGRCGAAWQLVHQVCAFCACADSREQSYFAAERHRESRRAVVCERCRGYLKVLATLKPMHADEILLHDMMTLELDVAAIEHGYMRPEAPGFALDLWLEPDRLGGSWR